MKTVVKWAWLKENEIPRALLRLLQIGVPGVPRLLSLSLTSVRQEEFTWTRTVWEKIDGKVLIEIRARQRARTDFALWPRIETRLRAHLVRWRELQFTHGDLSPRNIICSGSDVFCIDPVLCPNSSKGTPRYRKNYKGEFSPELDKYCLAQILEEFRFPGKN